MNAKVSEKRGRALYTEDTATVWKACRQLDKENAPSVSGTAAVSLDQNRPVCQKLHFLASAFLTVFFSSTKYDCKICQQN